MSAWAVVVGEELVFVFNGWCAEAATGQYSHILPTRAIIAGPFLAFLGGECVFQSTIFTLTSALAGEYVERYVEMLQVSFIEDTEHLQRLIFLVHQLHIVCGLLPRTLACCIYHEPKYMASILDKYRASCLRGAYHSSATDHAREDPSTPTEQHRGSRVTTRPSRRKSNPILVCFLNTPNTLPKHHTHSSKIAAPNHRSP